MFIIIDIHFFVKIYICMYVYIYTYITVSSEFLHSMHIAVTTPHKLSEELYT